MALSARCVFLSSINRCRTWTLRRHDRRCTASAKFVESPTMTARTSFSTESCLRHSDRTTICVTFVNRDGEKMTVEAKEGQSLLDVAVNNQLDLEGFGACGGSLSCSTCHLILTDDDYAKIESQLGDEEMDLLDLSNYITDTSRLGCQVVLSKALDGMVVRVPKQVTDARQVTGNQLDTAD